MEMDSEERKAHTLNMVKAVMECIVGKPIVFQHLMEQKPIVKKKARPINPLRHRDDGTYNTHSLDPEYNRKYYNEKLKGITVKCPCCDLELFKNSFI